MTRVGSHSHRKKKVGYSIWHVLVNSLLGVHKGTMGRTQADHMHFNRSFVVLLWCTD